MPHGPALELHDPLAEFLGVLPSGGTFRYTYEDAVKLSGHSCPTVAGAYLVTAAALRALYPGAIPVRGQIAVTVGGAPDSPSAGPMSQVITLLTGAAAETGFAGLAGKWPRRGLLRFDPGLEGAFRFRRLDSGAEVEVRYQPAGVPAAPEMRQLMQGALADDATLDARKRFSDLWQARVSDLLSGDPGRVIQVQAVSR